MRHAVVNALQDSFFTTEHIKQAIAKRGWENRRDYFNTDEVNAALHDLAPECNIRLVPGTPHCKENTWEHTMQQQTHAHRQASAVVLVLHPPQDPQARLRDKIDSRTHDVAAVKLRSPQAPQLDR